MVGEAHRSGTTVTPEEGYLQVRGLLFHYLDWGGTGRPLLLLHGLASNARFWTLAAPHLVGGFRVVALDQRGHGLSAKPDDGYDFPTVAGDIVGAVEALGFHRPVLVGHSWGGNVVAQVAADHPEVPGGIVCIDGGFIDPAATPGATWEETRERLSPPDWVAMDLTWEQFLERARGWGTAPYLGDRLLEFLQASFEVNEQGRVRPRLTRERHLRIVRAIWEQRASQLWGRVRCPVLLLPARRQGQPAGAGMAPEEKEARVRRIAEAVAGCRVVWMEDSIHDVPLQRPALVAETILQAAREGFFPA